MIHVSVANSLKIDVLCRPRQSRREWHALCKPRREEGDSGHKMIRTVDLYSWLQATKIMLVEDDEWVRSALNFFFESEGCRIMVQETAAEGIAALRQESHDIILADYRLPDMDGLEFLRQVHGFHPPAVEILLTAYKDEAQVREARELGLHDLIEKPLSPRALEASLLRVYEGAEPRRCT